MWHVWLISGWHVGLISRVVARATTRATTRAKFDHSLHPCYRSSSGWIKRQHLQHKPIVGAVPPSWMTGADLSPVQSTQIQWPIVYWCKRLQSPWLFHASTRASCRVCLVQWRLASNACQGCGNLEYRTLHWVYSTRPDLLSCNESRHPWMNPDIFSGHIYGISVPLVLCTVKLWSSYQTMIWFDRNFTINWLQIS